MTAADRTIRWSTAVAVIEVAAVAAVVSYEHAYALVCAHGETGWTARWLLGLGSRRRLLRTWPTAWATAWSERSWRCGLRVALVGSYELLMIIIRSAQVSAEMDSEVVVRVPDRRRHSQAGRGVCEFEDQQRQREESEGTAHLRDQLSAEVEPGVAAKSMHHAPARAVGGTA